MDMVLSVCLGLGLSAASGFRVFVPLLVISVSARTGHLTLAPDFEWIATTPALVALGVATVLELAAYYIPFIDNLLDALAMPAAVIAGIVVTASVITGLDPYLKWTLAVIAGGGLAGGVKTLLAGTRLGSTVTTAGFGNPVLSTLEAGGSMVLSLLSVLLPVAAVLAAAVFVLFAARRMLRGRAPA